MYFLNPPMELCPSLHDANYAYGMCFTGAATGAVQQINMASGRVGFSGTRCLMIRLCNPIEPCRLRATCIPLFCLALASTHYLLVRNSLKFPPVWNGNDGLSSKLSPYQEQVISTS